MTAIEPGTQEIASTAQALESEIAKLVVGQRALVRGVVVAMLAGGHVLLEGLPGLGKTMLVRTMASSLSLRYSRIQFTPDLMPADVVGTNIVVDHDDGRRGFLFQPGPIFANLVLADEINRATPRTQSALLEAMQEQTVTVGTTSHRLPRPFFVLATQNPIELEGTYPLPEAELDRFFFKLQVAYPTREELGEILRRTTCEEQSAIQTVADEQRLIWLQQRVRDVPIASYLIDYAARLVLATHPEQREAPESVRRFVRYGASPRAGQAIVLAAKITAVLEGRFNVAATDLRTVAPAALRHRVILNYEGEASDWSVDRIVEEVIRRTAEAS